QQLVVEQRNLAPVRGSHGGTFGVNGRNGGLQSVGTEAARSKSALGERDAFGDLVLVPERPILLLEQDQVSAARGSGGAPRLVQQHEPQQAHHLGFREQVEQESAQTDGLAAKFGACRFRRVSLVEDQIDDQEDGS